MVKELGVVGTIATVKGLGGARHSKVSCRFIAKIKLLTLLGCGRCQQFVKDVKVSLTRSLMNESNLFQKVRFNAGTNQGTGVLELQFNKLAETRRIVVSNSAGIAKGLQHWIRFKNYRQRNGKVRLEAH